jgi:hypothetical protein
MWIVHINSTLEWPLKIILAQIQIWRSRMPETVNYEPYVVNGMHPLEFIVSSKTMPSAYL